MSEEKTKQNKPNVKPSTLFTRDNLEVLRGLESAIFDLIYLDPPFNSNRDYNVIYPDSENKPVQEEAFKDTWTMDDVTAAEIGELASISPKLHGAIRAVSVINGDSHGAYLTKMAVRLIELHRVLKPTGSIYLHCDPTMSHSLKLIMDAIFGLSNFRNEIIWSYQTGGVSKKWFGRKHDVLFFYTKTDKYKIYLERVKEKRSPEVLRRLRTGVESATRAKDEERLPFDVWSIPALNAMSKERTGWPTQKPLELLRRIVDASSKEDDWVLDPFCGCATTCVAAAELDRKWVGIDIAPLAVDLVKARLKKEIPLETQNVISRVDVPRRKGEIIRTKAETLKQRLFGVQQGMCLLCLRFFHFEDMQMDHEVPRAQGGQDDARNMQLLCANCNLRVKGGRTMAQASVRIGDFGTYQAENEPLLAPARRRLREFRKELEKDRK